MRKIKDDFPIFKRKINKHPLVYLDNSATTQKPEVVIDAISNYYKNNNANIHRGIHTLAEESTQMYEDSRISTAKFINAKPSEIIFTRNATESINLVMRTWGVENINENDAIIISEMEHHSNIVPWQQLCNIKKSKLLWLNVNKDYKLNLDELEEFLKNNKCDLVSITHVSNVLGTVNPIEEIISLVHKYGSKVLIDACQSIASINIDVKKLDCDFLVFSSHKMFGPTGVGVLYVKEEILDDLPPFLFGGDMIADVTREGATWNIPPYKFEAGTPNIADVIGLKSAIEYINDFRKKDGEMIENNFKEISEKILFEFNKIPNLKLYGINGLEERKPIFSFNLEGIHSHDVAQILDEHGVAIRSGMHCAHPLHRSLNINASARVSISIYNTLEDVEILVEGLNAVNKKFSINN